MQGKAAGGGSIGQAGLVFHRRSFKTSAALNMQNESHAGQFKVERRMNPEGSRRRRASRHAPEHLPLRSAWLPSRAEARLAGVVRPVT